MLSHLVNTSIGFAISLGVMVLVNRFDELGESASPSKAEVRDLCK